MPLDLHDCLLQEYPQYPRSAVSRQQDSTRKAKSSSQGTGRSTPPAALVKRPVQQWKGLANNFLGVYERELKQRSAAENEDHPARAELRIEEADVVRVSYTYITHPLLIAINRKHTTPIGVKAEEKLDEFRQDFSFNADQDNPTRKMIMIIEFKRNHLIKLAEFTVASKATLEEGQNWLISEERTTLK